MRVRILGPFDFEDAGRRVMIGGVRQRAVLADLLLHANEVVPSEQILVDLWGEDAPLSAANALQAAISRLRRLLPPGRLITTAPGYMLRIFPAELDVAQFEQLVFEGRDALAAGRAAEAARLLDQAMTLWRGPPLADFRYEPFAQAEIARLDELQLACLEERNEAHLALGSATALTAELGRMVAQHPLRERLRAQLMLALYRSGRQTEALEAYREFRTALGEDLGLEPSSALRELEVAILRHDPVLAPASATTRTLLARRPVTVLCVALHVTPSPGAALDPEAHGVVTEHVVSGLTAVLERHGGKLAASDSEHLMGVFGVATLHEDDALRAVRASLEAREALVAEAGTLPRRYHANLVYRFGLATGEALVGSSGPLGFAGDVGARAVTLAEAAEPGQILLSHQTRQLAAGAIETDGTGPDRFLLRSAHADLRPLAVRLDAPLVGRREEMRRLEEAYARAVRERVTMTVSVVGEAGQGKTRLVQEFARGPGRDAHVLTGRCLSYGEGITFWPLQEVVRQAGSGDDSPERIKDLLADEDDAAAVAGQLHRALGPGSQGRTAAAEIFWAARRFLEVLARRRPVLAVFEDLHWAEPTFLDLVESLALEPGQSPITLVCVARPELLEQRPAWAAETERAVSIQLPPLEDGPAASLLDALTADQRLAPSTRARLMDTAAGNPLYLEQLAASLSEQAGSDRPALPPTIQALLAARLQRLGPGASSVLVRAAIVGKDFGEREIRGLLPAEARAPLGRNLQSLIAKGLVQEGPPGRGPDEEYSFRHILIQEAAYRSIPKSLRAELHHRYADWLEAIVSEPFPARSEILGYHLEQSVRYRTELGPADPESADPESAALALRAAAHLETAGVAAHDRGDDVAAVNLLDRAAALLPGDDPALGRLYTTLGTALVEAGQPEKARAALDQAQRITAAHGDDRQHAHARVEALLLHLQMNPDVAEMEIARALPELRREFEASKDDLGICRTLQLEAAPHWNHSKIGPGRICLAARRRVCPQGERPEATGRYRQLARLGRALGPDTRAGRDTTMPGLPRRDQEPPPGKGRDPPEPGGSVRDAGRLRGGTGDAQLCEIPAGNPRSHDDRDNDPARRSHCHARRRSSDRREVSPARIRLPLQHGGAALPRHHRGHLGQSHRGARAKPVRRGHPADRDKPGSRGRRGPVRPGHRPGAARKDPRRPRPLSRSRRTRARGDGPRRANRPAERARRHPARTLSRPRRGRRSLRSTLRRYPGARPLPAQGQPPRSPGITPVPDPIRTCLKGRPHASSIRHQGHLHG